MRWQVSFFSKNKQYFACPFLHSLIGSWATPASWLLCTFLDEHRCADVPMTLLTDREWRFCVPWPLPLECFKGLLCGPRGRVSFTSPARLSRDSNPSQPHHLIIEQLQTAGGGFSSWESEMLPRKTQKKSQSQSLANYEFVRADGIKHPCLRRQRLMAHHSGKNPD